MQGDPRHGRCRAAPRPRRASRTRIRIPMPPPRAASFASNRSRQFSRHRRRAHARAPESLGAAKERGRCARGVGARRAGAAGDVREVHVRSVRPGAGEPERTGLAAHHARVFCARGPGGCCGGIRVAAVVVRPAIGRRLATDERGVGLVRRSRARGAAVAHGARLAAHDARVVATAARCAAEVAGSIGAAHDVGVRVLRLRGARAGPTRTARTADRRVGRATAAGCRRAGRTPGGADEESYGREPQQERAREAHNRPLFGKDLHDYRPYSRRCGEVPNFGRAGESRRRPARPQGRMGGAARGAFRPLLAIGMRSGGGGARPEPRC